jgi:hypothetical protein
MAHEIVGLANEMQRNECHTEGDVRHADRNEYGTGLGVFSVCSLATVNNRPDIKYKT